MQTETHYEAPVLPAPAPRKSRKGWYVAGALVLALGIGAGISGSAGGELGREPVPVIADVEAPVVTETTIGEAAGQSVPFVTDAVDQFDNAVAAMNVGDVNGAADATEAAADDYAAMSTIWIGVDQYLSDTNAEIADEMYAAADDLRAMRVNSSITHIERATSLIEDATAYTGTLG